MPRTYTKKDGTVSVYNYYKPVTNKKHSGSKQTGKGYIRKCLPKLTTEQAMELYEYIKKTYNVEEEENQK